MTDIKLDHAAIGEILRVTMRGPIDALGQAIAASVDTHGVQALVDAKPFTTDRAISVVRISHPTGLSLQAKYGVLTKAAASQGLEVKAK